MTSHDIPEHDCPNCGKKIDVATGVLHNHKPKSGDILVCWDCRHIMAYADDLSFRPLTDKEIIDLAGDKLLLKTQRILAELKKGKK